jgi:hypothetical protein
LDASGGGGLKVTASRGLYDMSSVPKNSRGGVQVTDAEISAAFQFFDVDGTGKITTANVRIGSHPLPE